MQVFDFEKPVCILSGNEFLPKEGITFAQQVLNFFLSQGGLAHSLGLLRHQRKKTDDWHDGRPYPHWG